MSELSLWFAKSESGISELERTLFTGNPAHTEIIAVRGKTAGAYKNAGTFQWTPGVKALTVVFLTAVSRSSMRSKMFSPLLVGERGSLASSLDYALNKQPEWLFDMFGADNKSNAFLRQLLLRSNTGRRRSGPVSISLNEKMLSPQSIKVYIGDKLIDSVEQLEQLAVAIMSSEENGQKTADVWNNGGLSDKHEEINKTVKNANRPFPVSDLLPVPVIVPLAESDIDDIFRYESEHFSAGHAARERLLEWLRHDPNNYICIKEPGGPFLAYYLIMFLKPESMKKYLAGDLSEIDIAPDDFVEASAELYARQEVLHICVFAARTHASIFTFDLLWHLISRLRDLVINGSLKTIYAEIATHDGKILVERFGFKFIGHKPPEGLLYKLELSPAILNEWEWRYKLRTFCKTPIGN